MKSLRHWNSDYIVSRIGLFAYERMFPENPWLTKTATKFLDSWLHPADKGVEWGSGRSTLWFSRRVSHLTSIEHDKSWYENVNHALQNSNVADNVKYSHIPVGSAESKPDALRSYGKDADDYVHAIDDAEDNSIDFALIDGLERDRCTLSSIPKIKSGGLLILDNIQWYLPTRINKPTPYSRSADDDFHTEKWKEIGILIKDWRCYWTTNGVWDTAIWFKP